jgi:2'-5' RNA ligase
MIKKLYPVVTYFDQDFETKVRELQHELFVLTGSRACLDEWRPHVTVGKALWIDKDRLANLTADLTNFVKTQSVFEIEFNGYGFMDDWAGSKAFNCEPYIVYADVAANDDLVVYAEKLGKILAGYEHKHVIFKNNFHLTLAFKDLDKPGFEKAKQRLSGKSFLQKERVVSLSLATAVGETEVYEEIAKFEFGGNSN